MTHLGIIIAIEAFVIILIWLGVMLALRWRQKKRLTTGVEQLLNQVDSTKIERKQWLEQFLSTKHHVVDVEVPALSQHFITAEKIFLQHFVRQQLEQSSLVSMHVHLRELLDQYLQLMPYNAPQIIQNPVVAVDVPVVAIVETSQVPIDPDDEFLEVEDASLGVAIAKSDGNGASAEPEGSTLEKGALEAQEVVSSELNSVEAVVTDENDWDMAFDETLIDAAVK